MLNSLPKLQERPLVTGEQALPLLTSSQNPRACLPTTSRTNYGNPSAPGQQSGAYPLQMGGGATMETMPHKGSKKENGQRPHPESLTQRQNKAVQSRISPPLALHVRSTSLKLKGAKVPPLLGSLERRRDRRTHSTRRSEVACKGQES